VIVSGKLTLKTVFDNVTRKTLYNSVCYVVFVLHTRLLSDETVIY